MRTVTAVVAIALAIIATASPAVADPTTVEPTTVDPSAIASSAIASSAITHSAGTGTSHRALHLAGLAVAAGLYTISETVAKDALAPDTCRWCAPPGFDATVRAHLRWAHPDTAGTLSNISGYALSPLVAVSLLFASSINAPAHWQTFGDDTLAVAEAATYTQLAVQAFKFAFGRQRPFVHFATAPRTASNDDNLSFLSGHSALTFSLATAAGSVAQRRGYALAPVIWAAGLGLAVTTAYLRIAADKHYLTDVLAGSALGALGGLAIPRLTHALPADLTIVPSPTGVTVLGAF